MYQKQNGYIVLILALVVSGIGAAVAANMVLRSTDSTITTGSSNKASKASALAKACLEQAFITLKNHKHYGGDETIIVNNGPDNTDGTDDDETCRILTIEGTGNTDRLVQTQATVQGTTQYQEAKITQINPDLNIAYQTSIDSLDRAYGEVDTFTQPGGTGSWQTITFENVYDTPVIVGTRQTENGNQPAMIFEARNVTSTSAEVRLCESDGGNGCDSHTEETGGYIVIDAADVDKISGLDAGTFSDEGAYTDENVQTISFSESYANAPAIFTSVQSANGESPVAVKVATRRSASFDAGICHQDNEDRDGDGETADDCDDSHVSETVGWVSFGSEFTPSSLSYELNQNGTTLQGSGNWTSATFTSSFSNTPTVLVENVTDNGGQDLKIDEAKAPTSDGMDFRFCELNPTDTCDVHNNETSVWLALQNGTLGKGSTLNLTNPWRLDSANLTLWLKAGGILQNSGARVSSWVGQSDQTFTFDQSTSDNQPTLQTDQLSGQPVVKFDGNDVLTKSSITLSDLVQSEKASIFIVQRQDGNSDKNTTFGFDGSGSTDTFLSNLDRNDTLYFDFGDTSNGDRFSTSSPTDWDDAYHLVEIFRDGTTGEIRVDNTSEASNSSAFSNSVTTSNSASLYIGSNTSSSNNLQGQIAEIIIYRDVLTDSEKNKVRNYLNSKYNLY